MYAFLFPGQGSQRPEMGQAWRDTPSWSLVERLSEAAGRDIGRLLLGADAEELKVTGNAQLATFTLSLVILDAVRAALAPSQAESGAGSGSGPFAVAGHSLGEYSALVAAGVLEPAEGARLVAARGVAMEAAGAAQAGTMAAVLGLDADQVAAACAGVEGAWIANDNAAGQVVIAGTAEGVDHAGDRARALGAKRVIALAVSGAFHTPLMQPAQEALDAALAEATFGRGGSCVANVDAAVHSGGDDWRRLLSAQLTSPVLWRQSLICLSQLGVTTFVELGPGTELSGMVKRTVAGATRTNVAGPEAIAALTAVL